MNKVALITFHASYNFGAVLQAYATQETIKKVSNYETAILNYRTQEEKRAYNQFGLSERGTKGLIKRCMMFWVRRAIWSRNTAFEKFFADRYNLTKEVGEPEEALSLLRNFDIAISGSDQVLNRHIAFLKKMPQRYMDPYLLKGYNGRKISYASSIGSMTDDDLKMILPELDRFDALSLREEQTAVKLSKMLGKPIPTVLDPTFLFSKAEWIKDMQLKERRPQKKYLLAYLLLGISEPRRILQSLRALSALAKKRDRYIKLITPKFYVPYTDERIEAHYEFGPLEFLDELYNAEAVVTDSYHGTIFSVIFDKEFYSVCYSDGASWMADYRKTDILAKLGLSERVVRSIYEIPAVATPISNWEGVHEKLGQLREQSIGYLREALMV